MRDRTSPTTRSSWRNNPPDGQLVPLDYREDFTPDQVALLSRGLLPLEMEDRWFIFREGESLYFHRSWTGMFRYRLDLAINEDGGGTVREAFTDAADPATLETLTDLVHCKLLEEKPPLKVSLWRKLLGA